MAKNQESETQDAALYVDGFNLYHPIAELGQPHLKWVNLWKLGENLVEGTGRTLARVVYCSAIRKDDVSAADRHRTYISALRAVGVEVILGHYIYEDKRCATCKADIGKYTEKQTDINVALRVILDGIDGKFETAYLLSADSDQAATARVFQERLPDKRLISVAPPNRDPSEKVGNFTADTKRLGELDIKRALFGPYVTGRTGNPIRRPREYDPPPGRAQN